MSVMNESGRKRQGWTRIRDISDIIQYGSKSTSRLISYLSLMGLGFLKRWPTCLIRHCLLICTKSPDRRGDHSFSAAFDTTDRWLWVMCMSLELQIGKSLVCVCLRSKWILRESSARVSAEGRDERQWSWRRVRPKNDEVWVFANAPVSDLSSTVLAREWMALYGQKASGLSPGWMRYSARSSWLFFT